MELSNENIELYLFRYKEGMLDAAETSEIEEALSIHPEWREMADLYDPALILPAGVTMTYADAESLRDGGPKAAKRKRIVPVWIYYAAAACVLLAVGTLMLRPLSGADVEGGTMVASNTITGVIETRNDTNVKDSSVEMVLHRDSPLDMKHQYYAQVQQPVVVEQDKEIAESYAPVFNEQEQLLADAAIADGFVPNEEDEQYIYNDWNNDVDAVYSNRLITYMDNLSEVMSLQTPVYEAPANQRGDAMSQLTDLISDIAAKSGSFVANTRRRHQEREDRIIMDIEHKKENNLIIKSLIASIL